MTGQAKPAASLSELLEELAVVDRVALPPAFALRPGAAVGRFVIKHEIGRGGFGVVYAALDPELGRTVALKVLRNGSVPVRKSADWLRREAEAVARLAHPNIVTLHDHGRAPGGAYLVFELLRGEDLAARLARGAVAVPEAVRIALAMARALAHAHAANVLHRDLKPGNVFLCEDGTVKVLDFGIAHLFERGESSRSGTPAYMAPEQWAGGPGDPRTDLFALGCVLYELLTGDPPYGRAGVGPEGPAAEPVALPRSGHPRRLRALLASMLHPNVDQRPAAATRVVEELEAVTAALRPMRRRWRVLSIAFGVLLAGTLWLLLRQPELASGERVVAALAEASNDTGDQDLDRLSDLLTVALGESHRIQVLTRERMLATARALPGGRPLQNQGTSSRLLAELAGAHVVLVPSIRREGEGFRLEVRGENPDGGRPVFAVSSRARDKATVVRAVDDLADAVRRSLRERADDLGRSPARLASMSTPSLTAFREYLEGVECMRHPPEVAREAGGQRCSPFFERALSHDPTFGLAHYQLAHLHVAGDGPDSDANAHMEAALRALPRLSRRDAAIVKAWKEHLEGRTREALALYDQVLAENPDDWDALYLAGDLLYHHGDYAAASSYFQAVIALEPYAEWPLDHLIDCLGLGGREAELRQLLSRFSTQETPRAVRRLVLRGLVTLGDWDAAVALARGARARGDTPETQHDEMYALVSAGRYDEVEPLMQVIFAAEGRRPGNLLGLAVTLGALGRFTEAERAVAEAQAAGAGLLPDERAHLRSLLVAGAGNPRAQLAATELAVRLNPAPVGQALVLLALHVDPDKARSLAGGLAPDSVALKEIAALQQWRRGELATAVAALVEIERGAAWTSEALPPSLLLAEVQAASGEPLEVIEAAGRFWRTPARGPWRGWAFTRSLLLVARAQLRLGQKDKALATRGRLLSLLSHADRGLPLVAEVRALGEQVDTATVHATRAQAAR